MGSTLLIMQRILTDFPCLMPRGKDLLWLEGYLTVNALSFKIELRTDCSVFLGDGPLNTLLSTHSADVKKRLSMAQDAHTFLLELRDIIERITHSADPTTADVVPNASLPSRDFYERLLREVRSIGWERVRLHDSLRELDIVITDEGGRPHSVAVTLQPDYPSTSPTCIAALPEPFRIEWGAGASLTTIVAQFERKIDLFQDLFRAMDDLDSHCYVLEPEHPSRADTFRRLALGRHCSVRMELDARAPIAAFPNCRFLGPDAAVTPLRDRLNAFIHLWDASGDTLPRANLEKVLGQDLPPPRDPDAQGEDELAEECGICYSYRLDDLVPDIACDREACAKPYHRACLVEWLRALPDTRQSFDTLMGACVYCEHAITVSINES